MKRPVTAHIPNFLTCMNILAGCIAVVMAFRDELTVAACLIGIAAVFDFLDGMAARLLKAYSELGKQLDSLADMISFGFAPSVIMFRLLNVFPEQIGNGNFGIDYEFIPENVLIIIPYLAFLIAIFSALRLAKFNIDTRQSDSFIGLATPANAIFIASLPLVTEYSSVDQVVTVIFSWWFLVPAVMVLSYLLIAEFPMFSLKVKSLKFRDNHIRYIFLGISLILLISIRYHAIPLIIVLYILLSGINNLISKQERKDFSG